jgi:hypothetical protein
MTHTPVDIFLKWLSDRANDARVAVAIDGDRLLADAGVLGKEIATDRLGRPWRLVVFRGDDLAFRLAYRKARIEKHVLIVLARSTAAQSKIDMSYVTDILAANEGGPPLDLSVPSVFRRICPKINFPVTEIRRFKEALLERLEAVPKAADKIVERWGRPDDWGRGQVAALVLLAQHPDWALSDIWPDEIDPATAVAHGLRVLLSVPSESPELPIIRQLLQDAVYPQVREYCFWFDLPTEEFAGYLLIRAFAQDLKLQNPVVQLAGLQVFPLEMPLDRLEILSGKVIAGMRANVKAWQLVEKRAEDFITPKRSERLAALLPGDATGKTIRVLASAAMLFLYLRQCLLAFFGKPAESNLDWTTELASHPVLKADFGDQVGRRRQCLAAARLAQAIYLIESRLATTVPAFAHADDLLKWYVSSGHHRLELEAARGLHDLTACEEEDIIKAGQSYFSGVGDEMAPSPDSLGFRVRQRLDALDADLAKFVQSDPARLANDAMSIVGFLKGQLDGELTPILSGDSDRRVWVLMVVSQAEVASHQTTFVNAVFYRYAKRFKPSAMSGAVAVDAGSESHYLCVGRQWLKREGVGTSVRYSHGGLSLSEVVIPAFRLERVTEQFAAIELTGIPAVIVVDEDHDIDFVFNVRNKGNVDSSYELVVRTNLGDQLMVQSGSLAPAAIQPLKCRIHGSYKVMPAGDVDPAGTVAAVELRLRHTDQAGKWRDAADGIVNVGVKVHGKKTKLATDALAGFDEV